MPAETDTPSEEGGSENINVVISDYEPHVQCNKGPVKGPPWESCFHVFADMKSSRELQVFGPRSDPHVQVRLPFTYKASKS